MQNRFRCRRVLIWEAIKSAVDESEGATTPEEVAQSLTKLQTEHVVGISRLEDIATALKKESSNSSKTLLTELKAYCEQKKAKEMQRRPHFSRLDACGP